MSCPYRFPCCSPYRLEMQTSSFHHRQPPVYSLLVLPRKTETVHWGSEQRVASPGMMRCDFQLFLAKSGWKNIEKLTAWECPTRGKAERIHAASFAVIWRKTSVMMASSNAVTFSLRLLLTLFWKNDDDEEAFFQSEKWQKWSHLVHLLSDSRRDSLPLLRILHESLRSESSIVESSWGCGCTVILGLEGFDELEKGTVISLEGVKFIRGCV